MQQTAARQPMVNTNRTQARKQQARKRGRERASKRGRERASEGASKRASERGSKRATARLGSGPPVQRLTALGPAAIRPYIYYIGLNAEGPKVLTTRG